ncbi:MAG: 2-C-methyl-D-erythritol 2,4-cyclodiphosphate synthase [Alphaproteobacteria bacterium]|nr:2-C-methyl-D-erythritol 2,4-cyclodiphosphate synthase [Alphaproteobacteria bacterium]
MNSSATYGLLVAAGRGSRMQGEKTAGSIPKQYLRLNGRIILTYSLQRLLDSPAITAIRPVIAAGDEALYAETLAEFARDGLDESWESRLLPPVIGGAERQDSVRIGLESLTEFAPQWVVIHDAARPLLTRDQLAAVLAAVGEDCPAAIAATAIIDSVKLVAPPNRGDPTTTPILSLGSLDRSRLWRAMTPQVFDFARLAQLHQSATASSHSDDASLFEAAGLGVRLVATPASNLKITTAEDIPMAEAILSQDSRTRAPAGGETRVATGFDVHSFGEGHQVTLCGVQIPHTHGLVGHSDADVGLHALTDALLGTIAAGDIGLHFPPSDPKWQGADSAQFLQHAAKLVRAKGGQMTLVDVTLICESPKISPHRSAMTTRIAELLGIAEDRVSVKATTTEGLGFTGRREGIAALATATVILG